jgi:hypothetical protein
VVGDIDDRRPAGKSQRHRELATIAEVNGSHPRRWYLESLLSQIEIKQADALLAENFDEARLGQGRQRDLKATRGARNRLYPSNFSINHNLEFFRPVLVGLTQLTTEFFQALVSCPRGRRVRALWRIALGKKNRSVRSGRPKRRLARFRQALQLAT